MSGVMWPLMNFISNLGYVFIAVLGGVYVTRNLLNLGDITAFIQYSRSFSMPIIQTASIANVIQSTMACAERVFTVLDEPEEQPDASDAIVIAQPKGAIAFDHVDFSYRATEPLIRDMNLDVKQGDTVAIVGPTGAGKTTLVNLLMRFYDIQGGAITFDGVETRKIGRGSLRTMFGMVLQDTWLFNGTIRENIAYGRDDATEEEIVAAARAAHADHFIRSLPEGYNTVLNEEASNISAGQKQLLTIARVVLANPAVLILDEATSSVDTRTEVRIQKAMAQLMAGRTSFVIAHRLSTIRDAHHILVMDHGSIVEQGTHKELLARHGFYADLYNSQFTGAARRGRSRLSLAEHLIWNTSTPTPAFVTGVSSCRHRFLVQLRPSSRNPVLWPALSLDGVQPPTDAEYVPARLPAAVPDSYGLLRNPCTLPSVSICLTASLDVYPEFSRMGTVGSRARMAFTVSSDRHAGHGHVQQDEADVRRVLAQDLQG